LNAFEGERRKLVPRERGNLRLPRYNQPSDSYDFAECEPHAQRQRNSCSVRGRDGLPHPGNQQGPELCRFFGKRGVSGPNPLQGVAFTNCGFQPPVDRQSHAVKHQPAHGDTRCDAEHSHPTLVPRGYAPNDCTESHECNDTSDDASNNHKRLHRGTCSLTLRAKRSDRAS
jgi:hypothetical protein